ncbi:hypothetical protein [Amycolatopsis dongchuanensis]|uniref:Uncharacterized protein n=1 Tax=Amycolatopsis dongchuanensis TaxID=1070866 RepID=A0ABP8VWD2_9PSEU
MTDIDIVSTAGVLAVPDLTEDDRTTVEQHWQAVTRYLESGNPGALGRFAGATVGGYANVPEYRLATNLDTIDQLALIGDI